MTGDQGNNPWAWVCLFKWSVNNFDGTKDNCDISLLSVEDKNLLKKSYGRKDYIWGRTNEFFFKFVNAMEYYQLLANDEGAGCLLITNGTLEDLLQEPHILLNILTILY